MPYMEIPWLVGSDLVEEVPILYQKRIPDLRSIFHCIPNQLSLLSKLQVDLLLVISTLYMRHIDGDEYVG